MKICLISQEYPPEHKGGVSDYNRFLLYLLQKKLGQENVFFITTSSRKTNLDNSDAYADTNVLRIMKKWSLPEVIKLLKIIKKLNPDIVHLQCPFDVFRYHLAISFLPLFLKILYPRISVISTLHEFTSRSVLGKLKLSPVILFSNKIGIVTEAYRSVVLNFLWLFKYWLRDKIIYIPNPGPNITLKDITVEQSRIPEIRKKIGAQTTDTILCFFGYIRRGKGINFLLESFRSLINDENIKNVKLLFVGNIDNIFFKETKSLIKDWGLESYVHTTGYCSAEEVSEYLTASDICVLPFEAGVSTKRGSFITVLFYKIPLITTRSNFVPEGLVNYENVILVDYGNKEQLKKAMLKLIKDKGLREKMRQNIPEILENFSWNTFVNRTIDLYKKVIGSL